MDGACSMDERWEMRPEFWSERKKERDHSEVLGVEDKIIFECSQGSRVRVCGLDASGSG
jgi:hypothetical protein